MARTRTERGRSEEIERLRRLRGWTVEELAIRVRCSQRTIKRVLAGDSVYITTLRTVATVFGVPYETLVEGAPVTPAAPQKHEFHMELAVTGLLPALEDATRLVTAPLCLTSALRDSGIIVISQSCIVNMSSEDRRRVLVLVTDSLEYGDFWALLAVPVARSAAFLEELKGDGIISFVDWGIRVAWAAGDTRLKSSDMDEALSPFEFLGDLHWVMTEEWLIGMGGDDNPPFKTPMYDCGPNAFSCPAKEVGRMSISFALGGITG